MTFRAVRILKEVDLITAEDTRHTRKLLSHFDIHTPATSLHQHNEAIKAGRVIESLQEGKNVALVSDAGMPGISDPGAQLVSEAVKAGIKVVPIPGPTAAISGLVISGLPTDRFVFEGFLPRGKKQRRQRFKELAGEERTIVLYEAPHRLKEMLEDLTEMDAGREIAVARELTKTYEEVVRGTAQRVLNHFRENQPRGEFTVIIAGAEPGKGQPEQAYPESVVQHVTNLMAEGLDKKQAMKEAAILRNVSKREVYKALIDEK